MRRTADDIADAISLWRNRNYVCYRVSRTVSMLGSQMSGIAYPLLVLGMGEGAVRAGAVGTCSLVARMAFQLPAGHLSDRFDLRRLMLSMDAVRFVAVGSIPLAAMLGSLAVWQLLVVALIEGAASAVFGGAAMVFLRVAVPPGQFARAMSQSQGTYGLMGLIGPVLGGALYAVDRLLPFIADTASYVFGGALLLAISTRGLRQADGGPESGKQEDRRVTAGFRWLFANRNIFRLILYCSVFNMVGAASGISAVLVMSERGVPASVIGIVLACSGSGMVVGSLAVTRVMVLGPVRLFLIDGFLWVAAFAAIAVSSSPWVVGAALVLLSALAPSTGVTLFKVIADEAPKNIYGRVNAADTLVSSGLATIGPLVAGAMVAAFGGTYVWLVLSGICLAATVVITPTLLAFGRTLGKAVDEPREQEPEARAREQIPEWADEPEVVAHAIANEDLPGEVNKPRLFMKIESEW